MQDHHSLNPVAYLVQFKDNLLGPQIHPAAKILNKYKGINQEISINSTMDKKSSIAVYKQIKGVQEFNTSERESHSIILVGDEIKDFLDIYFGLINQTDHIMPKEGSILEVIGNVIGTTGVYSLIGYMAKPSMDATYALMATLGLIVGHQIFGLFTFPKQMMFQKDHKIYKLFSNLNHDEQEQLEGFWQYSSFHYELPKYIYKDIMANVQRKVDDERPILERAPFGIKKILQSALSRNALEYDNRDVWLGFDFLFFNDPLREIKTLTITVRSSNQKPAMTQKKPVKSKDIAKKVKKSAIATQPI